MTTAIAYANAAWDWGLPNPVVGRNLDEPDGRVRWLTFEEADAVVEAAKDASRMPLLADLITVALHTGCRKGELLGLVWTRVDLKRTVLPVPGDAPGLRLLRRQAGKDIRGAFSAACSAAGITDFTFHDLRHVAGYRRGKARGNTGPARPVPLMAERYAHLAPENLQETMSILDASRLRHAHVGDPEAGNKSTDASP